jgi:histone demethylase JARID1
MASATAPNLNIKINLPNGNGTTTPPTSRGGRMGVTVPSNSNNTPNPSFVSNINGIPLSARKSAVLDLRSVEQRNDNVPFRGPKSSRPHGLLEAPTFYPTEVEFKAGPLDYIRKIEPEGRKYGIVKIVPPAGWNPPFAIDTEVFLTL